MSNKITISLGIAIAILLGVYFFILKPLWTPNVNISTNDTFVYIPTGSSFDDVVNILNENHILKDEASFRRIAVLMRYNKDQVPAGKYKIGANDSNRSLITKLRSGDQDPSQVVVNNVRLLSDLAGKASRYFEADSLTFLQYMANPETSSKFGFNPDNFLTMFIPNTYEMFWTNSPEKFVNRMNKEYEKFWTAERENKLNARGIDKTQAYIVASIVEKESNYDPERPTIAGVYLNRLKSGEKLQADPTVVFATGQFDLQRVLYAHLETDSPYNTYKYAGLPPGPICMPSLASLNAVIDSDNHNYMFFCAKADNSGIHAFAVTYEDHQKNAAAFAAWMNKNKIK